MSQTPKAFHLSIAVRSLTDSKKFFEKILGGTVVHEDPAGYVNVDLFGSQITLKENPAVQVDLLPDFHFGFNCSWDEFGTLTSQILESGYENVIMKPKIVDPGTPLERIKMYLKSPTGYLVELKGHRRHGET